MPPGNQATEVAQEERGKGKRMKTETANPMLVSPAQMKRLQTLYGQLARHTDQDAGREARLAWASELTGRAIASFSDLTQSEALRLIDTIQGQLGVRVPPKPRRRLRRADAHKAGTAGRRGNETAEATLAGAQDLARIRYALDLLGWNQSQLDGWLRSPHSPLRSKASPEIRTLYDANRVWWALKGMAKARGLWKERK
jgi:hypothetical protein